MTLYYGHHLTSGSKHLHFIAGTLPYMYSGYSIYPKYYGSWMTQLGANIFKFSTKGKDIHGIRELFSHTYCTAQHERYIPQTYTSKKVRQFSIFAL